TVDRSGATFQTYPALRSDANPCFRILIGGKSSPPLQERSKALPEFGLDFGVLAARGNQLFAVSLAAT
ncbi:hypothetical protein Q9R30_18405, partial [Arthrobacter sp. AB6]|uniref:hypothetical protein n=1 Tax=Arthrobacter sp. AB6 TaxID=2962570 RepID=UPI0028820B5D